MIFELRNHLRAALIAAGIPERFIEQRQGQRDEFQRGTGAYLYPSQGEFERFNKPVARGASETTRVQFVGPLTYVLELICRDEQELENALGLFLRHLIDTPLVIGGVPYKCPSRPIRASWLDSEGVLVDTFTTRLEITAETALLEMTALVPITVELTTEIEEGNPNE